MTGILVVVFGLLLAMFRAFRSFLSFLLPKPGFLLGLNLPLNLALGTFLAFPFNCVLWTSPFRIGPDLTPYLFLLIFSFFCFSCSRTSSILSKYWRNLNFKNCLWRISSSGLDMSNLRISFILLMVIVCTLTFSSVLFLYSSISQSKICDLSRSCCNSLDSFLYISTGRSSLWKNSKAAR